MENKPPHTHSITTHDFMNVESFSQLPFLRPSPAAAQEKERAIRVFGIEFGASHEDIRPESGYKDSNNHQENNSITTSRSNSSSNRRFECHYCCRNFPTSQALGGHQNAHKRERQHAKRIHLQSTTAATAAALFHYQSSRRGGLMGYGGLSDSDTPLSSAVHSSYHPSWPSSSSYSRVYSNRPHHHGFGADYYSQMTRTPINGGHSSAVTAAFNRDRCSSPSNDRHLGLLFSGDHQHHRHELNRPSHVGGGGSSGHSLFYESKTSVQDHVSLDLHL